VREVGEFAVEAIGCLPERHVADTVVPRHGRGRADGEHVLGHRRQYDRVASYLPVLVFWMTGTLRSCDRDDIRVCA
jgi:hypothetical protein